MRIVEDKIEAKLGEKLEQVLSKISTLVADIIVRSWNKLIMKLLDITCNNYSTVPSGITDLYRVD
nr:6501_t:CDS:2 [Entrophospora candida]